MGDAQVRAVTGHPDHSADIQDETDGQHCPLTPRQPGLPGGCRQRHGQLGSVWPEYFEGP
jgi:hypothetical protein